MIKTIALALVLSGVVLGGPLQTSYFHPVPPMPDGRIIGGENATISNYPYQVALLVNGTQLCGGGIISSTWIVTAGHCVVGKVVSNFSIRAGSSYPNSGGQIIRASRVLLHAKYNDLSIDYDISVIQLVSAISDPNAIPVALAASGSGPITGATATVTGWGYTTPTGSPAGVLQVVRVPVVSQESCRRSYSVNSITDRMFCAGYEAGGRDACSGDSGGPLILGGVLTGLVSWGSGCARPNLPGVYTNIPSLRSWITSTTGI